MPSIHIALLRGINVGGKNRLPMKRLTEIFTEAGAHDVRTYIQSGNVVYRPAERSAEEITQDVTQRVEQEFGIRTPIVVRSGAQIGEVLQSNPFSASPEEHLHVIFLAHAPSPDRISLLDPHRSPPEEYIVSGSEIYLRAPNGVGQSKLTNAYLDSKLATISTSRNWRTVTILAEMAAGG
jgi:uncharacterized protein (DUF1697 family)